MPDLPVVSVEGGNRSLNVSWTQPSETGEQIINGSRVFVVNTMNMEGLMPIDVAGSVREVVVPNLVPFTNYTVAVLACNRFNGRVQCGPRSELMVEETLQDCMLICSMKRVLLRVAMFYLLQ